jgi:hypothetical protein
VSGAPASKTPEEEPDEPDELEEPEEPVTPDELPPGLPEELPVSPAPPP